MLLKEIGIGKESTFDVIYGIGCLREKEEF